MRLTESEGNRFLAVYDGEPTKQVTLSLMVRCGCRVREAVNVRPRDVRQGDETGRWFLRIPSGKGEKERQTPMPMNLAEMVRVLSQDLEPDDRVLDVTSRTVRRWVGELRKRALAKKTTIDGCTLGRTTSNGCGVISR